MISRIRFPVLILFSMALSMSTLSQEPDDGPLGQGVVIPYTSQGKSPGRDLNPLIVEMLEQINADSIRETIRYMQEFNTRFLMVENRKEVADWIAGRLTGFGVPDVRIDSFLAYINWNGIFVDTLWQYNVIGTLTGQSAPDEIYVVGGHYDSFCTQDPYSVAPGADDNASAVAATLEIARVMQLNSYHPEATIQFILFGAEELGLFGSRYQAGKSRDTGEDVRFMLNMDMISNNPDSVDTVKIFRYQYCEWASYLAAEITEQYTSLDVVFSGQWNSSGSDSRGYWEWGFPATYLEEFDFSPNWHHPSDTIGNCNIEYCAEVTRAACAILMAQQFLPYPQSISVTSGSAEILISWLDEANARIAGWNIYRSEQLTGGFARINATPVTDTFYSDIPPVAGKEYYYQITIVNDSSEESGPSRVAWGALFSFSDTLLVVSSLKSGETTPDSIYHFYESVLDTIPFIWFDLNDQNRLDLGTLSRHRNVLWLQNDFTAAVPSDTLGFNLVVFFANGGNILASGFLPGRYWGSNSVYPFHFPDYYFISKYFKIDSVDRQINSFMYRAYPVADDYDTLRVDSLKSLIPEYPGELLNIEVFAPTSEGRVIYRFDSHYYSGTNQGKMQDRPVGIEYMGEDFKTILLSFPLYYMDTMDARHFLAYVLKYKFGNPTGIPVPGSSVLSGLLPNYPNPFSVETTIPFILDERSQVTLTIYSVQGKPVMELVNNELSQGIYHIKFSSGRLPAGLYQVVLKTERSLNTRKIVLIR